MKLPRRYSMNQRAEFLRVRQEGQSRAGRFVIVATLAEEKLSHPKLAFVTSKRVSKKACERNRVRRLLREVIIKHGDDFQWPRYIVTIARTSAVEATFEELEKDWLRLARKLDIKT